MNMDNTAAGKKNADFNFHGGLKLNSHKEESTQYAISHLAMPDKLILPLRQHIGQQAKPLVQIAEHVLKGQLIANTDTAIDAVIGAAIHAPTSGTVSAIVELATPHPSSIDELCIEIESDGEDRWIELNPIGENYHTLPLKSLLGRLRESGIVGLGGATFPASVKLQGAVKKNIHTLIINGAECEPWISCDQLLMQERAKEILRGIEILLHITQAKHCIIGIEDNKPLAIEALASCLQTANPLISVISIPTIYPTGGERQLSKVLTNKEIPAGGLPSDIGLLIFNVATVWAVYDFIYNGKPLVSRVVTVTGDAIERAQNIEAAIGSPIVKLIEHAGGYKSGVKQLTMGGPMMGFSLASDDLPLTKACNCLLAQTHTSIRAKPAPLPCIRCSACTDVCPARLLPQQLYWYSRAKKLEALERFNINSCIECGCCDYVCPSHIPLTHYFRYAKTGIIVAAAEQEKADIARQRHESRIARLAQIKEEKAQKMAAKKLALKTRNKDNSQSKDKIIADALERSRKRKQLMKETTPLNSSEITESDPSLKSNEN